MNQENKKLLRNLVIELSKNNPDYSLQLGSKLIKYLLFSYDVDEECYKVDKDLFNAMRELHMDFEGLSFKDVDIAKLDFTKLKNVSINPQEVYEKNLNE